MVLCGFLVVAFGALVLICGLVFVLAVVFGALLQTRDSVDDSGTSCSHFE